MMWNSKDVVPPLGKRAIEMGNKDSGVSVPLLFKYQSGEIGFGTACVLNGKVEFVFSGEVGTEFKAESLDSVVSWMLCPKADEIVGLMALAESLRDDGR